MPASEKTRTPLFGTSRIRQLPFEFLVALIAAGGMVFVSRFIRSVANPSFEQDIRVGHVSALAAMQIPFFLIASLSLFLILVSPHIPKFRELALLFSPALLAGAATGYIAGSINIALAGTNWPLFGSSGDSGVILEWIRTYISGQPLPETYPPGYLWLISGIATIFHAPVEFSAKLAQIVATAAIGPIGYIAWRLVVGPFMSLALGVVAMLPLISPYKPYPNLMLVVLLALVVRFVIDLRRVSNADRRWAIVRGLLIGAGVGITALIYSGWFVWSALGIFAVVLLNFPWRAGKTIVVNSLWFMGSTLVAILGIGGVHLIPMLRETLFGHAVSDSYFYSDTFVDPAYYVMAQSDQSDGTGWPPLGELGGVGVFMMLLAISVAIAIAFSWKNPIVQVSLLVIASALAARYFVATLMVYRNAVYLWPRTQAVLIFALLLIGAVALRYLWNLLKEVRPQGGKLMSIRAGLIVAFALVLSSSISSISSAYYPMDSNTTSKFAFYSQHMEPVHVDCFPLILLERCPPAK